MAAPAETGPMIKGAFMRDARNWARTAYGAEAYQSALAKLSPPERAIVDGMILSHHLPTAIVWVLEQSGARDAAPAITRRDVAGGKLLFEVSVTYR